MGNRKKIFILLIGILLAVAIILFVQIYAKYISSASTDTSMKIANWNILVNDLSIKTNTDISDNVVPVFPGNDNISSDIIAPTAEGYFDLNFDFSGADVSFKYEINTNVDETSSVQDLVATGYSVDDGEKIVFENFNDPITDTVPLDTEQKTRKIRIYVMWNDDESTSQMTNDDDTDSTKSDIPALFHVDVAFTQVVD